MSETRTPDTLRIALAQANPTVGDVAGNLARARRFRDEAAAQAADVIVFPELFLAGYPPEDLVLKPAFQAACRRALDALAADTADGGPDVLIGLPFVEDGRLYNSVAHLAGGALRAVRHKVDLPNYGVFDEKRVFAPGPLPGPIPVRGVRVGVPICEDIWTEEVVDCLAETGGELLISPNGSPYWRGKADVRLNVATARVVESGLPLIYLNQVGGQDELVFDGASFGLNADRSLAFQSPAFAEDLAVTDWRRENGAWRCAGGPVAPLDEDDDQADYRACVLGLRDYVAKSGFPGVVLGLSGGVDSALCAAMAVDALGADKVRCVMLPYRFTSEESLSDAAACAEALGVPYDTLPIAPAVEGIEAALAPLFGTLPRDVTEENLQSRARGLLLMALSNKFGPMVVTTGNKSEMSVGYATLYGDMNGGFNPIKDLYKTQVFRLCRLRNRWRPADALGPDGPVMPGSVIDKPPSAELRENQKDEDSLPPYETLDAILQGLVEDETGVGDLIAAGFDPEVVSKVERLLYLAEYKRRQSAPGVKVTARNFGRDRRYPIINRFRDPGTRA
ncbi:NAD+ synthase [Methylopila jiangsuensis]|uniref:Glutamine-dependent NAD(+) synthetase n=1 Tax=Methylopila jiangsuensis TaxID=586230 RepID=A0A9W6JFX5_9HYPH|nr:NAD+ synthase [Methylopila jiangsuensis]MDR6287408.1 NAD+ synthase [Methylopila jiangsuensis]GLK74989.1 NAD+ synthase [Methylopila jiangsuensis]